MRGIDGRLTVVRTQSLPEEYFHELDDTEDDDGSDGGSGGRSVKPAPAALTLVTVEKHYDIATLVEENIRIEGMDDFGNVTEVALPSPHRAPLNSLNGSRMPVVAGIATVPVVAVYPRGGVSELIEAKGLHPRTGIYFDIPKEIRKVLPGPEDVMQRPWRRRYGFFATNG